MRIVIGSSDIPLKYKKNTLMMGTPWLCVAKYNRYSPVTGSLRPSIFSFATAQHTVRRAFFSQRIRSRNTYLIITITGEKRTWHFAKHKIAIMADLYAEKQRDAIMNECVQSKDAEWRFFSQRFWHLLCRGSFGDSQFILTQYKIMPLVNLFKQIAYDPSVFQIIMWEFSNSYIIYRIPLWRRI